MSNDTKHLNQEQLVDYRYSDAADSSAIEQHLHDCADCAASYATLLHVLAVVDQAPVPDPGADYEARLWRKLSPELARPKNTLLDWSAWHEWFTPKRLVPIGAVAVLVIAAFFVGRIEPVVWRGKNVFAEWVSAIKAFLARRQGCFTRRNA